MITKLFSIKVGAGVNKHLASLFAVAFLGSLMVPVGDAQTTGSRTSPARAEKFEIKPENSAVGGILYVTVNGAERKIYDPAFAAWIINDGRDVVFSSTDGAGGFEDEGQSLRIYNVRSRAVRKIMSEYSGVNAVQPVQTSTGALALLVKLQDGGLGGSYFAVVDPARGEVFYRRWAEATTIRGDIVTLSFYRESDWETINNARKWNEGSTNTVISNTKVKPERTEQIDLKAALKGPVIFNRKTNELTEDERQPRTRDIKIYLWNARSNAARIALTAAVRQANSQAPLRPALEALFAGPTKEEEGNGLSSSTFGMKFAGVTLRNGIAVVKFSQPPSQTNYGSLGPMIFAQAIEKTARQFPTVRKVEICAVGDTLIDSQLEKRFSKCRR